jgi:hypothetical protein
VGLDVRRQFAVPPLEAGDVPRGRGRPLHRPLAPGDQSPRRGPAAVRAPSWTPSASRRRPRSGGWRSHPSRA